MFNLYNCFIFRQGMSVSVPILRMRQSVLIKSLNSLHLQVSAIETQLRLIGGLEFESGQHSYHLKQEDIVIDILCNDYCLISK